MAVHRKIESAALLLLLQAASLISSSSSSASDAPNAVCAPCPPGEYAVRECTAHFDTVCWPCEAGFACGGANGSKTACIIGKEWSDTGAIACEPCSAACDTGWMLVKACDGAGTSDRVCARCPSGFGCTEDGMRMCRPGAYSHGGVCVSCGENRTTKAAGAESEEECVCLFNTTADGTEGECSGECAEGYVAVKGECRVCPTGFGCDGDSGHIAQCKEGTYSSHSGMCIKCVANSHSAAGAGSAAECVCDVGYTKEGYGATTGCAPCRPGTVYRPASRQCEPCPAGQYCLGRLHHDPCPEDMFSSAGSAICSACRMNSGCARPCTHQANCSCDDGFVDHGGECRRCPAATMKPLFLHRRRDGASDGPANESVSLEGCVPCPRGMECLGGAEVRSCELATFSGGNRSRCSACSLCREITVARCNASHDSVCEVTPYAIAVISLTQYYRSMVSGETFAMFALVLASSLPKAQLVRVCSGFDEQAECVRCFQGQCPMAKMKQLMSSNGHAYELEVEIRPNAVRLSTNVESLTQTAFLPELAKTTMAKLTDLPFTLRSRVEHRVLCPEGGEWNGGECVAPMSTNAARSWLGLGVSIVLLAMLGAYGGSRRREGKVTWARVEEVTGSE